MKTRMLLCVVALYGAQLASLAQIAGGGGVQFTYKATAAGITITGYSGVAADLIIPDRIEGLPVIALGERCFQGKSMMSVTVPASVTRIERGAFFACTNLTRANFTDGLLEIVDNAFSGCTALGTIYIPKTLNRLNKFAFSTCSSLRTITVDPLNGSYASTADGSLVLSKDGATVLQAAWGIQGLCAVPEGVMRIAQGAFIGRLGLTTVTLPASLVVVEPDAFLNCSNLSGISLSENTTSLGNHALASTAIRSLRIPAALVSFTAYSVAGCALLSQVEVAPANPAFSSSEDRSLILTKDGKRLIWAAATIAGSYVVAEGVEHLDDNVFSNCQGLLHVFLPASLRSAGRAFAGCGNLLTANFKEGLVSLHGTFDGCRKLVRADLPATVISLGEQVFYECFDLILASLPPMLESIGDSAFYKCLNLVEVSIPGRVASIGKVAFAGCDALRKFSVDPANTVFFTDAGGLVLIDRVAKAVKRALPPLAGTYAIPSGVTLIDHNAFRGCVNLEKLILPASVATVEWLAFSDCPGLKNIYFKGPAPALILVAPARNVFSNSGVTKVFYARGVTGWPELFSGLPTLAVDEVPVVLESRNLSVVSGDRVFLQAGVASVGALALQWFGQEAGGAWSPISGAQTETLIVPAVVGLTRFKLRATDQQGFFSESEEISVSPVQFAEPVFTHLIVNPSAVGGVVAVSSTIRPFIPASGIVRLSVLLPKGAIFLGGSSSLITTTQPSHRSQELLEWSWASIPAGGVELTYALAFPPLGPFEGEVIAFLSVSSGAATYQTMAKPDPLVVRSASLHTADTNRDGRIGLLELTRVIELYNYRTGGSRTGQYKPQAGTEDGFAAGPP
jgi:hypothetical protein